jgi:AcrR family transcriptional regulator
MAKAKTTTGGGRRTRKAPVTREAALKAAVRIADTHGLEELSMRRLARELGCEAMSLYHHFAHKEAILDGMVEHVFEQFEAPHSGAPWRSALRKRMHSMRRALLRHPWAVRLLDSRTTPSLVTLAHHDAVLGVLRAAGFSVPLSAVAYALLDSFVYGFVVTELSLPFRTSAQARRLAKSMLAQTESDQFPHLREFTEVHVLRPGYSFAAEFDRALELVLDALELRRAHEAT